MAYNFVRTSSQRIAGALSSIAVPLTLHARFAVNHSTASTHVLFSVDTTSGNNRHILQSNPTPAIAAVSNAGSGAQVSTGPTITSNVWSSGVGRFSATNSRLSYLDGSAGTVNTGNATVTFNQLLIAATTNASPTNHFNGDLADVAVWDVALTADEITSLAKGFKPCRIRPQSLRTYVPLIRNIQDLRGVVSLTATNGPTVADHPRVY